jgi:hypothetical protein
VIGSAYIGQVDDIARDIARLRRRFRDDEYTLHLVDRLAGRVESLDAMLFPAASELVEDGWPVQEALTRVDGRAAEFRRLLGKAAA